MTGTHKICFIHIPKCAGTSIYNALKRHFDPTRIRHLQPGAARKAAEDLGRGLDHRSDILAYHLCEDVDLVFGHYQITEKLIDAHPEYDYVTLLRDPVARFVSNFFYNQSRSEWVDKFGMRIDQFLAGPAEQPESLGHNYIRFLGFENPRESASIESAIRVLDRFAIVGIVEQMDRFVDNIAKRYGLHLNLARENVGPDANPPTPEQLRKIEELCAPNLAVYRHAIRRGGE